jgi:hypothetical protein
MVGRSLKSNYRTYRRIDTKTNVWLVINYLNIELAVDSCKDILIVSNTNPCIPCNRVLRREALCYYNTAIVDDDICGVATANTKDVRNYPAITILLEEARFSTLTTVDCGDDRVSRLNSVTSSRSLIPIRPA